MHRSHRGVCFRTRPGGRLRRISDLKRQGQLTAAFSSGFLEREDGWPGLARQYGLSLAAVAAASALATPARAANAFDASYQDVFGYRTEGRSLYAGIRLADRR